MKRAKQVSILAAICVTALGGAALAEPVPLPTTDYATKGTMAGGIAIHYRHGNGRMRMEMKSRDMPQPMVGYFDVRSRKGIMVMSMPGMPPMAMETGMDDDGAAAVPRGNGRRIGSDRVAGEACDEWQLEGQTKEEKATDAVVCLTRDGIMLRMVGNVEGKRQTIIEITEVSRAAQDPKLLTPPANLKPMQIPGMPARR